MTQHDSTPSVADRSKFVQFSDGSVIFPKNLGWLHKNLSSVRLVRLTQCVCSDCIRTPGNHDFALRANGSMVRGYKQKTTSFEYVIPYASFEVFDSLEAPKLRRAGIKIEDEVRANA